MDSRMNGISLPMFLYVPLAIALVLCVFGYRLRRLLSLIIGLCFGFEVGMFICTALFDANINSLSQIIDKFLKDYVSVSSIQVIIDRIKQMDVQTVVITLVSAFVFAILGAIYYRFTLALVAGVNSSIFIILQLSEGQMIISIALCLLAFAASYALIYLFYDSWVIAGSCIMGAVIIMYSLNLVEYESTDTMLIAIAAFEIGVICQSLQKHLHDKRVAAKQMV